MILDISELNFKYFRNQEKRNKIKITVEDILLEISHDNYILPDDIPSYRQDMRWLNNLDYMLFKEVGVNIKK